MDYSKTFTVSLQPIKARLRRGDERRTLPTPVYTSFHPSDVELYNLLVLDNIFV
jgi:hypothetical protein